MRIGAKTKVRLAPPVFQVMARFETRTGEVRNLVARDPGPRQAAHRCLIKAGDAIVGGNILRPVALAESDHFRSQAAVLIDLQHVDRHVLRRQPLHPVERFLPGSRGLPR